DDTGATNLCPIVAGHRYLAEITHNSNLSFIRFYLYDLTAASLISPTGDQFFNGGFGVVGANASYSNFPPNFAGAAADHILFPLPGGVVKVRLAGIDNQIWDTTVGLTHQAPASG